MARCGCVAIYLPHGSWLYIYDPTTQHGEDRELPNGGISKIASYIWPLDHPVEYFLP
jgi:hypothetical protein